MSDETTRAAAEHVIEHAEEDSSACIVAREWLSEHPADDAELIDEEWLREVGFAIVGRYGPSSLCLKGLNTWKGNNAGDWQFRFELSCMNRNKPIETRGDVRRLCAALGLPLTPPSPTSTH